jgi:hypothetical protein
MGLYQDGSMASSLSPPSQSPPLLFSSVTGETAVEIRPEPPSLAAASAGE